MQRIMDGRSKNLKDIHLQLCAALGMIRNVDVVNFVKRRFGVHRAIQKHTLAHFVGRLITAIMRRKVQAVRVPVEQAAAAQVRSIRKECGRLQCMSSS